MPANAAHVETGHVETGHADAAPDAAKRPGRPRSERAEQAIIDAALDAFAEFGVEGVRLEDVAASWACTAGSRCSTGSRCTTG